MFTGIYILGRELKLVPFDTWVRFCLPAPSVLLRYGCWLTARV
jgi:hypothetical protein